MNLNTVVDADANSDAEMPMPRFPIGPLCNNFLSQLVIIFLKFAKLFLLVKHCSNFLQIFTKLFIKTADTEIANHQNPPKTIHNHPKLSTNIHSHPPKTIWNPQEPSATTRNHPQQVRNLRDPAVTGLKPSISIYITQILSK